jgi:hypothetical protein
VTANEGKVGELSDYDCHAARRGPSQHIEGCVMVNRDQGDVGAALAGAWSSTSENEFYDQHEASRYRSEAEARGHWNPPGGDSM